MATVAALLLAAGESTRMGRSKPLLPWLEDMSLVSFQVRALAEAGFAPIVVVLGHEAERVRPAVPGLSGVTIVEHSDYLQGRATSVVHGLKSLPPGIDAVTVLNVDSPRSAVMLRRLREAFEVSGPLLAVLAHQGEEGHPWLFSSDLLPELFAISEEHKGLREVEARHESERLLVEAGSAIALTNINTYAEYGKALRLARSLL
jgi:molybdenum cofactor cytidylyltransferase